MIAGATIENFADSYLTAPSRCSDKSQGFQTETLPERRTAEVGDRPQLAASVALPAERVNGANYVTIPLFCDDEKLSLCQRGHWFRRDGQDHIVFCFATRDDADKFFARFGGEHVTPETRPSRIEKRRTN